MGTLRAKGVTGVLFGFFAFFYSGAGVLPSSLWGLPFQQFSRVTNTMGKSVITVYKIIIITIKSQHLSYLRYCHANIQLNKAQEVSGEDSANSFLLTPLEEAGGWRGLPVNMGNEV